MPPTSHRNLPRAGRTAESLLGVGHPLVGVLGSSQAAVQALAAEAILQMAALGLWVAGVAFGRALAMAAALMEVTAGLRWASLRLRRRDLCRDLLIEGRGHLPIAPLVRERRRLLDPAYRDRLAQSLEALAAARSARASLCSGAALAAARPQLREVAALMRADRADPRGVALVDRLLSRGESPLYGRDVPALREELARARYLLA